MSHIRVGVTMSPMTYGDDVGNPTEYMGIIYKVQMYRAPVHGARMLVGVVGNSTLTE